MQPTLAARLVAAVMFVASVAIRMVTNIVFIAFHFNPLGALGLFGGSKLPLWQAALLPIAVMVGTDLGLAYYLENADYSPLHVSRLWVYPSFALYAVIGRYVIGDGKNLLRLTAGPVLGATQFFLVTNFFEWARLTDTYTQDFAGLMTSYIAALPYLKNTLAGDVIFTNLAFGAYAWLCREQPEASSSDRFAITQDRSALS